MGQNTQKKKHVRYRFLFLLNTLVQSLIKTRGPSREANDFWKIAMEYDHKRDNVENTLLLDWDNSHMTAVRSGT